MDSKIEEIAQFNMESSSMLIDMALRSPRKRPGESL